MRRLAPLATAALLCAAAPARGQRSARDVPTPASVLGFAPGADRKLPTWSQVVRYFGALDAASPRITVRTLGTTTLGRPFIAAFIGDSATIAHLDDWRAIQRRLADPRLRRPGERDSLIAGGKVVVLVTSSIHSTEVGGIVTPLVLAHRLVTGEDAESRGIRRDVLTILVPSLNPDGVDIVGDWYRSSLGTPWEGTPPPALYNAYVGHDDNRDWYAFTQIETRLTVDSLYDVWHPAIVNDIHQQGAWASRIFIPPYMDPIEPHVDPILMAGVNEMGLAMTWRLATEGKRGIANDALYDAWSPARAFPHYHGAIRILTETASARLASPIEVPFDSLRPSLGYDPRVPSWNFLEPWPGGRWTLGDIVDYQTSATWALLSQAARDRARWLESFVRVEERGVAGNRAPGRGAWPVAFLIPMQQPDQAPLHTLLRILQRGQVEIRRALEPFVYDRVRYSAGTYVVLTAQPYGGFATALLQPERYPNLREYPGGPPKRPYDVTAHALPLLMGVGVRAAEGDAGDSVPIPLSPPIAPVAPPVLRVPGLSGGTGRRIAIYRSYAPSMDEGWTRWVLDQYHIPHASIVNRDIRAGRLRDRFDVIIVPDESPRALRDGARAPYPDSLRGGIGDDGAARLKAFVDEGGTLVTFNRASAWAASALSLPVRDVLAGASPSDFYAPGSLLRVYLNRDDPLARLMVSHAAAWFEGGPAFRITDSTRATAVAVYPPDADPLLSGWLLGGAKLRGAAAMVDVKEGKGRVVLFGFRPQYRGQAMGMYPLLWAALLGERAGAGEASGAR